MKGIKESLGITLVALVVTIIVLIILATISINIIFGEGGIIERARNAEEQQEIAGYMDRFALAETNTIIKNKGKINLELFIDEVKEEEIITKENIVLKEQRYELTAKEGYVFEAVLKSENDVEVTYLRKGEAQIEPEIPDDSQEEEDEEMLGSGTSASPYEIRTVKQLQSISENLSAYYTLMNDLDLSSVSSWTPIGTKEAPFTGSFVGNGYTISNMKITNTEALANNIGLFGYASRAKINNLKLINYNITGEYGNYVGGLIGQCRGTTIEKVYTKGNINLSSTEISSTGVGGLLGAMYVHSGTTTTNIKQCFSEGNIFAGLCDGIGGLVGDIYKESSLYTNAKNYITNCFSIVDVTGNTMVGGLIGIKNGFTYLNIENSYSAGRVAAVSDVGGLTGQNIGTATNCYWSEQLSEQSSGVMGTSQTFANLKKQATFTDWDFDEIWEIDEGNSMPYLKWLGKDLQDAVVTNNLEGSGTAENPYMIANIEDLKKIRFNLSSYYKLANDITMNSVENWMPIGVSSTYPFKGNLNGDGHVIKNLTIYCTEILGSYVGLFGYMNKGTITNLKLEDYVITGKYGNYIGGLIGNSTGNSTIENISVKGKITLTDTTKSTYIGGVAGRYIVGVMSKLNANVDITITQATATQYVGGLIGFISYASNSISTIEKCYSEGNLRISNGAYVGGLLGNVTTHADSTYIVNVANCYSTVNVSAKSYTGGLIGRLYNGGNTVSDCYAIGKVEGTSTANVGGLVGYKTAETNCETSYWNTETSGQTVSALGEGKTTAQMQTVSTYSDWDTSIWTIVAGVYPKLK